MAKEGETPVPDPTRGADALRDDLPKVLRGQTLEEAGWCQPDSLTLLVPLFAQRDDRTTDFYLLRLYFNCYPEWPPSAQFVNPQTLRYAGSADKKWLPKIEGCQEIAVHDSYSYNNQSIQLICCSVTLEFYQVRHGVKPEHVWDGKHQNFSATLAAVRHGLRPPFHKGPMEARS